MDFADTRGDSSRGLWLILRYDPTTCASSGEAYRQWASEVGEYLPVENTHVDGWDAGECHVSFITYHLSRIIINMGIWEFYYLDLMDLMDSIMFMFMFIFIVIVIFMVMVIFSCFYGLYQVHAITCWLSTSIIVHAYTYIYLSFFLANKHTYIHHFVHIHPSLLMCIRSLIC